MAINHSVTQNDFTQSSQKKKHCIQHPCHRRGKEKNKLVSSNSAARYDANPFSTTQHENISVIVDQRQKNVTVKYCISEAPLRGDRTSSSPVTATYCLESVLRTEQKKHCSGGNNIVRKKVEIFQELNYNTSRNVRYFREDFGCYINVQF